MLSVKQVIISTLLAALVTFFTRVAPFAFFAKSKPSPAIMYIQRYIPPMAMVILVIYCLKDIAWAEFPYGAPTVICVLVTVSLHLWRGNALLSIFAGTGLYMFLIRVIQ